MVIAPAIAKRVFQVSAYTQILVGMSNLGVVFGVTSAFTSNVIKTPLPWLRFSAILLPLVWVFPIYKPEPANILYAWGLAPLFTSLAFGWAAGDGSLTTFIPVLLANETSQKENVSLLGAVMSFLYSSYIILYAIFSITLGIYIDRVFADNGNIKQALIDVGGIQFSVIAVFLLLNTLIPKGAFQFNPDILTDESFKEYPESISMKPLYKPVSTSRTPSIALHIEQSSDQSKLVDQYRYD